MTEASEAAVVARCSRMQHVGSAWTACRHLALLGLLLALCAISCNRASASPCADGCTTYGTCHAPLRRCDCPWNRTGPACLELANGFCLDREEANTCKDGHPSLCLNACSGRGRCMGGFCHCDPGFYGTDCALSLARDGSGGEVLLEGLGYKPADKGPFIYVYELPPEFHVRRNLHTIDRPPLHLALYERLLTSGHRTTDGNSADFYFIPVSGRDLKKSHMLWDALTYVSHTWPWWNATRGGRHLLPAEGDVGSCELPLAVRRMAENVTYLQFWGMHGFHPAWEHVFRHKIPCHVPGKDIVIPFMAMSSHDRFLVETPLRPDNPKPPRNITFFFSGGVCGSGRYHALPPNCTYYKQQRYSGGVRQEVYTHFSGRPGWRVVTRTDDYARDYSSARFCLAAAGGGWGKRGIVAAMYGCIPVAATDLLYEAFEPEMDWSRFGVRVAQKDIRTLGDLLDSMPEDRVAELQRRTACAAQHLHWSTSLGGIMLETGEFDVFATLMAILRMRVTYPGLDPARYYAEDKAFRDFMDCVPSERMTASRSPEQLFTMPGRAE